MHYSRHWFAMFCLWPQKYYNSHRSRGFLFWTLIESRRSGAAWTALPLCLLWVYEISISTKNFPHQNVVKVVVFWIAEWAFPSLIALSTKLFFFFLRKRPIPTSTHVKSLWVSSRERAEAAIRHIEYNLAILSVSITKENPHGWYLLAFSNIRVGHVKFSSSHPHVPSLDPLLGEGGEVSQATTLWALCSHALEDWSISHMKDIR